MERAQRIVLLAEPDDELRFMLDLLLHDAGYAVTGAQSLEEAEQFLSASHFDLVISEAFDQEDVFAFDPSFPTRLRSHAPETPVILCSSCVSDAPVRPGSFGLAGAVAKPFDLADLLRAASQALAWSRGARVRRVAV